MQSLQQIELTAPDKSTIFTVLHLPTKTASFFWSTEDHLKCV